MALVGERRIGPVLSGLDVEVLAGWGGGDGSGEGLGIFEELEDGGA
jgi:hypothetical protein